MNNHARKPKSHPYIRVMPRLEPMAVPIRTHQRRRAIRQEVWQSVTLAALFAALWCGLNLDSDTTAVAGMCLCGAAAFASYKFSQRG